MALKDLKNTTFAVDFTILYSTSSQYVSDMCVKVAGPKPADSMFVFTTGALAVSLLSRYWNTYIRPFMSSGIGSQAFIDSNKSSFEKKYVDIATWNNYFFILRTQILGAVEGNVNDPAIKNLDIIWLEFSGISGRWIPKGPSENKSKNKIK